MAASHPSSPPARGPVRVVEQQGHFHVVAAAALAAGETIFTIEGDLVEASSRYSIQIDDRLHVDLPAGVAREVVVERHPWRFLNHSCAPNAVVRDRTLVALRPIRPGDEITFHYNATEWEMTWPFTCRCGACDGAEIRGFRHVPPAERRRLLPHLAAHLRRRLDAPGA